MVNFYERNGLWGSPVNWNRDPLEASSIGGGALAQTPGALANGGGMGTDLGMAPEGMVPAQMSPQQMQQMQMQQQMQQMQADQNPINRFIASPGMAMAGQALNNMSALRRGQVPRRTPVMAANDVRAQNAVLMNQRANQMRQDREFRLQTKKLALETSLLEAEEKRTAAMKPNPLGNFGEEEQAFQRYAADGGTMNRQQFFSSSVSRQFDPGSVKKTFDMWSSVNAQQPGESAQEWNNRQREAMASIINKPVVINTGGGGVGAYTGLGGGVNSLVTSEDATQLDATAAGASTFSKAEATAANQITWSAPPQIATADRFLGILEQIKKHPGREGATGFSSITNSMAAPGSDTRNFLILAEQMKGSAFVEAFQGLKGGGTITEVEGAAATAAQGRLNEAQSDGEYLVAIDEMTTLITNRRKRIQKELDRALQFFAGSDPEEDLGSDEEY